MPVSRSNIRVHCNSNLTLGKVPGPRVESTKVSCLYFIITDFKRSDANSFENDHDCYRSIMKTRQSKDNVQGSGENLNNTTGPTTDGAAFKQITF